MQPHLSPACATAPVTNSLIVALTCEQKHKVLDIRTTLGVCSWGKKKGAYGKKKGSNWSCKPLVLCKDKVKQPVHVNEKVIFALSLHQEAFSNYILCAWFLIKSADKIKYKITTIYSCLWNFTEGLMLW